MLYKTNGCKSSRVRKKWESKMKEWTETPEPNTCMLRIAKVLDKGISLTLESKIVHILSRNGKIITDFRKISLP